MYELLKEKTLEERTGQALLQYGFLSDASRVTQAALQTTWIADLNVPWNDLKKRIPMIAMPNKIRVEVHLKTLQRSINFAAGTPAATITSPKLRCHYTHVPQAIRDDIFMHINSGNGVAIKTRTTEFHKNDPVPATGATLLRHRLRLRNIKNAVYEMFMVVRNQLQVDNTNAIDLNLWNFQQFSRFWLEDNGNQVTNKFEFQDVALTTPQYYNIYLDNVRAHPFGIVGLYLPAFYFCEPQFVERSKDDCFGSRNLSKYNNPELVVEYDSGNSSNAQYLDVWANVHNLLIFQKGDLRKYLI